MFVLSRTTTSTTLLSDVNRTIFFPFQTRYLYIFLSFYILLYLLHVVLREKQIGKLQQKCQKYHCTPKPVRTWTAI